MYDDLARDLARILETGTVRTLFQPIVDTRQQQVFGYEALSRGPSDSLLHAAPLLFETAERCERTVELERACLRMAAATWASHGIPHKLFVNVSPALLMPPVFQKVRLRHLLEQHGLNPSDIVVELSERYPAIDLSTLRGSLSWLQEQGFAVAIDDLGSGYSGLKLWAELKPDFVKIDRHFIRGIDADLVKKEFVRSVVDLSRRLGCQLIAEGVETEAEQRVMTALGITYIQGFLYGRPAAIPGADLAPLVRARPPAPKSPGRETARHLTESVPPASPSTTLAEAWERLQAEPGVYALPVVEDGRPLGLLHKWRVLETFSSPYGRSLNERHSVTTMLSTDALVVDRDTPLESVSRLLVDEDVHYLKQHFIVTENQRYVGLGSTRSVLQRITEEKVARARHANPLSGLPGNVPIQQEMERRVTASEAFDLIYFDINHFKPLNDVLGYRTGDQVIVQLADILTSLFRADEAFVGHIGGDDFVVMTDGPGSVRLCERAQVLFARDCQGHYPASMRQAGRVQSLDRTGAQSTFPLVSLSAGIVRVPTGDERTPAQLADTASLAKTRAKGAAGGLYIETTEPRPSARAVS
ncbi:diguanylate cyclase/phosphodiesterase [Tamilnaduibacter salinus]|uniref:Diguanylate cyclase/phosphodiesterase n=1 Tax=Tamilnaduibacter salinus TaxID=1484056 RepID=A0A2U1CX49_9GAMM|nr:GGDEF domain-containing protein [Tamilnaduibacter salinus]PVY76820.1 diguanylate cyclase/phosphodiesterase [Tamilnaduibacter salinus]